MATSQVFDRKATRFDTAPQQAPRPLPLFLDLLQRETAGAPERRAAALAGLRAYQEAQRTPRPDTMPVFAAQGRARLFDYGGTGQPVVFVPSLINPPFVLDLSPETSLLRWLSTQGVRPLLVDWGTPGPDDAGQTIADHVADMLHPMLRSIDARPALVGYCLGGTMAIAAAQRHAVAGIALIAAPWRFAAFGSSARSRIGTYWRSAEPACSAIGVVPMEVLQAGFWQLDPARTIAKFAEFSTLEPDGPVARSFVALEDWANGGAPLTLAAGRDLFDRFFVGDDPGRGCWTIGGEPVDPARLSMPVRQFVSASDRIVPAASAASVGEVTTLDAGHVGMVVGRRARATLWEPLARWCAGLSSLK